MKNNRNIASGIGNVYHKEKIMIKQNKYCSKKIADKEAKSLMTTLRLDIETKAKLQELQNESGLSQSQVMRKLICGEHAVQKDVRMEVLNMRDKLNFLGKICISFEDKQKLANLEQEYKQIKEKFVGGM